MPSQLVNSLAFLLGQASRWAERPLLPPTDCPPIDTRISEASWLMRSTAVSHITEKLNQWSLLPLQRYYRQQSYGQSH